MATFMYTITLTQDETSLWLYGDRGGERGWYVGLVDRPRAEAANKFREECRERMQREGAEAGAELVELLGTRPDRARAYDLDLVNVHTA